MQWLVDHFYLFILLIGVVHTVALLGLWAVRRQQAKGLAVYLHNLVKHFSTSADVQPGASIHEQIDSFLTDIREVVQNTERTGDREKLYRRLVIKDEGKRDVHGTKLETWYNVARTGIEIYPLLGILGTIFAIALGLNHPRADLAPPASDSALVAPASAAPPLSPATTASIIRNFANSIWSTASGIGLAIVLMLVNACIEPGFDRLIRQRQGVREAIAASKIHLGFHVSQAVAGSETGMREVQDAGIEQRPRRAGMAS